MKLVKQSLILKVDKDYNWMYSHTSIPISYQLDESVLRIFLGLKYRNNRSHPTFIDVNTHNPKIIYINF